MYFAGLDTVLAEPGAPVITAIEIRADDRQEFDAAVETIRALAAKALGPEWTFAQTAPLAIGGATLL